MTTVVSKGYAAVSYGQVHFAQAGDRANPPLVLLGPAPRSWRAFERMIPLLADRYRLVMPDPPCFGESSPPPPDGSMHDVAKAIVAVLDALGIGRAHVYGHNTGRLIAASLAADWPDRVDRLIIAGPTFTLVPEQDVRVAAIRSFIASRYFADAEPPGAHPALRAWATTYRSMIAPWWWTEELFAAADPAPLIQALENRIVDELMARRTLQAMYRMNFEFDFAEALSRARARTLIVEITGGSADSGGFERQGARLAARMHDATVVELPQIESAIGLALLTGLQPMADAITRFLELR
ncbi:MAG: alpha/beta fold hydrolase [Gammaproteobacteria bacterium]